MDKKSHNNSQQYKQFHNQTLTPKPELAQFLARDSTGYGPDDWVQIAIPSGTPSAPVPHATAQVAVPPVASEQAWASVPVCNWTVGLVPPVRAQAWRRVPNCAAPEPSSLPTNFFPHEPAHCAHLGCCEWSAPHGAILHWAAHRPGWAWVGAVAFAGSFRRYNCFGCPPARCDNSEH